MGSEGRGQKKESATQKIKKQKMPNLNNTEIISIHICMHTHMCTWAYTQNNTKAKNKKEIQGPVGL